MISDNISRAQYFALYIFIAISNTLKTFQSKIKRILLMKPNAYSLRIIIKKKNRCIICILLEPFFVDTVN